MRYEPGHKIGETVRKRGRNTCSDDFMTEGVSPRPSGATGPMIGSVGLTKLRMEETSAAVHVLDPLP